MASHILQVSSSMSLHQQLRTLSKTLSLSSHPHRLRSLSSNCKMSTETESSSPLTHSITLPAQLAEPVQIVAAPGISDSQFRSFLLYLPFFFCVNFIILLKSLLIFISFVIVDSPQRKKKKKKKKKKRKFFSQESITRMNYFPCNQTEL